MTEQASNEKQIVIEIPDGVANDLVPSREVTQEVLDLLDAGYDGLKF